MADRIETVRDLLDLLARMPLSMPLRVVPTPDIDDYASQVLAIHGSAGDGVCYLALSNESLVLDEAIAWVDRKGESVRPL